MSDVITYSCPSRCLCHKLSSVLKIAVLEPALENCMKRDFYIPYVGAPGMLLPMNKKLTIEKLKSSNFVIRLCEVFIHFLIRDKGQGIRPIDCVRCVLNFSVNWVFWFYILIYCLLTCFRPEYA